MTEMSDDDFLAAFGCNKKQELPKVDREKFNRLGDFLWGKVPSPTNFARMVLVYEKEILDILTTEVVE